MPRFAAQRVPVPQRALAWWPQLAAQVPRDARLVRNVLLVALLASMAASGGLESVAQQRALRGQYSDYELERLLHWVPCAALLDCLQPTHS